MWPPLSPSSFAVPKHNLARVPLCLGAHDMDCGLCTTRKVNRLLLCCSTCPAVGHLKCAVFAALIPLARSVCRHMLGYSRMLTPSGCTRHAIAVHCCALCYYRWPLADLNRANPHSAPLSPDTDRKHVQCAGITSPLLARHAGRMAKRGVWTPPGARTAGPVSLGGTSETDRDGPSTFQSSSSVLTEPSLAVCFPGCNCSNARKTRALVPLPMRRMVLPTPMRRPVTYSYA